MKLNKLQLLVFLIISLLIGCKLKKPENSKAENSVLLLPCDTTMRKSLLFGDSVAICLPKDFNEIISPLVIEGFDEYHKTNISLFKKRNSDSRIIIYQRVELIEDQYKLMEHLHKRYESDYYKKGEDIDTTIEISTNKRKLFLIKYNYGTNYHIIGYLEKRHNYFCCEIQFNNSDSLINIVKIISSIQYVH
jgi:hypothetical protein